MNPDFRRADFRLLNELASHEDTAIAVSLNAE